MTNSPNLLPRKHNNFFSECIEYFAILFYCLLPWQYFHFNFILFMKLWNAGICNFFFIFRFICYINNNWNGLTCFGILAGNSKFMSTKEFNFFQILNSKNNLHNNYLNQFKKIRLFNDFWKLYNKHLWDEINT